MTSAVRLLAGELLINGHWISWREDAPDLELTLFDSLSSLLDWLDFQRDVQASSGLREVQVVTLGHVLLPAEVAGKSGDYLPPDVLAVGEWRYHAPRTYGWRVRPSSPPVLRLVK